MTHFFVFKKRLTKVSRKNGYWWDLILNKGFIFSFVYGRINKRLKNMAKNTIFNITVCILGILILTIHIVNLKWRNGYN